MKVRRRANVVLRPDDFGGVCYVPHRDDFFAADKKVFAFLQSMGVEWHAVDETVTNAVSQLARIGICETAEPVIREEAYSGPSFLGQFIELPTVSQPLVLNCFCTAHCPLSCIYCHADDLMKEFRSSETETDLDNVAATANMVPAIVAVITGGDPLTRPARAQYLIERLAGHKALVLDTSGVGEIEVLLPILKRHQVHVRVSLDSVSEQNRKLRPANRAYVSDRNASTAGATRTIDRCLQEGIPVTVQSVVTARNDNMDEWRDLRDWLIARGVHNWVIHVVVKGGSARRLEEAARRQTRRRSILPDAEVYHELWRLVEETMTSRLPIDVRCTDTDTTPNSVLLIGSKGDLYTEGYAHNGKVPLYRINDARPDLIQDLWPHLDRFGHARRYLNWNPWFFNGESLEKICYNVSLADGLDKGAANPVETEAKYPVRNVGRLQELIANLGFTMIGRPAWQRDEYFDTPDKLAARLDYVVRLRRENGLVSIALKSPRIWNRNAYSRIEIEVPAAAEDSVKVALTRSSFETTWYFEKKRTSYKRHESKLLVALDEIPEIGYFVEIEGRLNEVREMERYLFDCLGEQETRNYAELFKAFKRSQGVSEDTVKGASFEEHRPKE
jgi:predicted adenylyl cyclase CyaB